MPGEPFRHPNASQQRPRASQEPSGERQGAPQERPRSAQRAPRPARGAQKGAQEAPGEGPGEQNPPTLSCVLEPLGMGEVYLPLPPPSRTPCQPNVHLRGQGRTDAHNELKTQLQRGVFPWGPFSVKRWGFEDWHFQAQIRLRVQSFGPSSPRQGLGFRVWAFPGSDKA